MSNNTTEIRSLLLNHIDGLFYTSESENPFELIELGQIWGEEKALIKKLHETARLPLVAFEYYFPDSFFESIITSLAQSDGGNMVTSDRYRALYDFIRSSFEEIQVIKSGQKTIDILIVLLTKDKDCFVLRTVATQS